MYARVVKGKDLDYLYVEFNFVGRGYFQSSRGGFFLGRCYLQLCLASS